MGKRPLHRGSSFENAKCALPILAIICCAWPSPSGAQEPFELDDSCIVSVLNRSGRVPPDGTWILRDIPFVSELVRARFSCVRDGETVRAVADVDQFVPDAENAFPADVVLVDQSLIPTSISISTPTTMLTTTAPAVQLTVTATFADGSVADVTSGSNRTTYSLSSDAVATASAGGLVTGLTSGTVLVTAQLDGALAFTRLQAALASDNDADGIPDDLELELGLDPNDPADALDDPDGDGLSNVAEIGLGTDIRDPDSEGDGIADGEEVTPGEDGFVTDPLLADTDGDFIPDATEVATATDPSNAGSGDLAGVLTGIGVSPEQGTLTVNTVLGEASQQLIVEGQLVDGRTTDLTSSLSGTQYESSDLLVCNFGAVDGEIFAGDDGACTITVTNNALTDDASFTVSTFAPVPLAFVDTGALGAVGFSVEGTHAYLLTSEGLQIWDVSVPVAPQLRGGFDPSGVGAVRDLGVAPGFAFVGGLGGLEHVDVRDPNAPVGLGLVDLGGTFAVHDIDVQQDVAYLSLSAGGLGILDISDPAQPTLTGTLPFTVAVNELAGVGRRVYLRVFRGSTVPRQLAVVDASDPKSPVVLGTMDLPSGAQVAAADERLVYLLQGLQMHLVDVSDPTALQIVGTLDEPTIIRPTTPAPAGDFVIVEDSRSTITEARVIDVSDPALPILRDAANFDPLTGGQSFNSAAIRATVERFYIGFFSPSFTPTNSRIGVGQYLALDDNDGVPPAVTIDSPGPISVATPSDDVRVRVSASDDVAVVALEATIDGVVVATDLFRPFAFRLVVPSGVSSFRVGARAFDPSGNVGTAKEVRVVVQQP